MIYTSSELFGKYAHSIAVWGEAFSRKVLRDDGPFLEFEASEKRANFDCGDRIYQFSIVRRAFSPLIAPPVNSFQYALVGFHGICVPASY